MPTRPKLLLMAIACLTCAAGPPEPVAPPGAGVDILGHALEITPDFPTQSLGGRQRIRFRVQQAELREIIFSNNALVIDSAELNGRPVAVSRREGSLIFSPATPLRKGLIATLSISYHGKPARGVTFAGNSIWTSYWACDWMICSQYRTADKAPIETKLFLPSGMRSLAVGTLRSERPDTTGRTMHVWRENRPYSAYLYGFAAGPFVGKVTRQPGYELAYWNAAGSDQDMDALSIKNAEMVRFLEEKAGIKLPPKRYSLLFVPGDAAQEAATYSLIGLSQLELKAPDNDWALIHELAHQWWGNLITCRNWDHVWLNEGVATFMIAAWKEHKYGKAAYEAELDVLRSRVARAKAIGEDRPVAYSGPYSALRVRRAIQYSKAALFLDHLRKTLGDAAFWSGLKLYTRTHAGGVVESRDFQRAFEKASKRDLTAAFNEWVYDTRAQ